jgi:protein-tyrosine phosphatase
VADPSAVAPGDGTRDRVVVLCLANRCRSPMAGAMLAREARLHQLPVDVVSAGFGDPGLPATAATIETAGDLDLDLRAHASRTVDRDLLAGADLVLGMERVHVREAVVLEPSVWPHAFTLREAVRRAEGAAPRRAGQPLREWLETLSAGRDRMDLMGSSPDDDVLDPTTDWTVDHATTAALLDDLVRRLVRRAWPA